MTEHDFIHPKNNSVEEIASLLSRNDMPRKRSFVHPDYDKMSSNDRMELALWIRSLDSPIDQRYDPVFSSVAIEYAYLTSGLDGARSMARRISSKFGNSVAYRSSPGIKKEQTLLDDFAMYDASPSESIAPYEIRNAVLCSGPSFKGISEIGKAACDDTDFYERCFEKLDQLLRAGGCNGILELLDAKQVDVYSLPKKYQIMYPIGIKWTGLGISMAELSSLLTIMNCRILSFLNADPKDKSEFPIFDEAIRMAYRESEDGIQRPEGRMESDICVEFVNIVPRMQCSLVEGSPVLADCDSYFGSRGEDDDQVVVPYDGSIRMNDAQEAYYDRWKSNFEQGICLDVTLGYLKRYSRECMASNDDPETVLSRLQSIEDRYKLDLSCESIIYRMDHGMRMPVWNGSSPTEFQHEIVVCVWDAILRDPIGHLGKHAIGELLKSLLPEVDSYPVFTTELVDNALVALDNYSKENNRVRFIDLIKQHIPDIRYMNLNSPFEKDKVYRIPISNPVDYYNAYVFLNAAVRSILKPLYIKLMRKPLPVPSEGLSSEQKKFLSVYSDAWIERRYHSFNSKAVSGAKIKDLSRTILEYTDYVCDPVFALNRKGISKAKDDLEAVTEMMSVDDDGIPNDTASSGDTNESESGWAVFFKRIGESGRQYLIHSLNGVAGDYCTDNNLKMNLVESEINNLSMDLIGDAVVLDGTVIGEYVDDIKQLAV